MGHFNVSFAYLVAHFKPINFLLKKSPPCLYIRSLDKDSQKTALNLVNRSAGNARQIVHLWVGLRCSSPASGLSTLLILLWPSQFIPSNHQNLSPGDCPGELLGRPPCLLNGLLFEMDKEHPEQVSHSPLKEKECDPVSVWKGYREH